MRRRICSIARATCHTGGTQILGGRNTAGQVDYFFDVRFSAAAPQSKYTRSVLWFGWPLEGYDNADDRKPEQDEAMSNWFRTSFDAYLKGVSGEEGASLSLPYSLRRSSSSHPSEKSYRVR